MKDVIKMIVSKGQLMLAVCYSELKEWCSDTSSDKTGVISPCPCCTCCLKIIFLVTSKRKKKKETAYKEQ